MPESYLAKKTIWEREEKQKRDAESGKLSQATIERPKNLADAYVFDDANFRDTLGTMISKQQQDKASVGMRPKEFEVIDKIYQNELEEI